MPDTKISALPANQAAAAADVFPIVQDFGPGTLTTAQISLAEIKTFSQGGAVLADGTVPLTAAWDVGNFNVTNIAALAVGRATMSSGNIVHIASAGRADLFVAEDATGRIGIGTATPTSIFHVAASGQANALHVNGTSGKVGIGSPTPSATLAVVGVNVATGGTLFSVSSNAVTGTINAFSLTASASTELNSLMQNTGAGRAEFGIHSNSGDAYVQTRSNLVYWSLGGDASDSSKFKISNNTVPGSNVGLTIDTSLNVGIGTESPGSRFHVSTTGSANALRVDNTTGQVLVGTATGAWSGPGLSVGVNGIDVLASGKVSGGHIINLAANTITGALNAIRCATSTTGNLAIYIQQNGNGGALQTMTVIGTGDPFNLWNVNGGQAWSMGLDQSDGTSFKICNGSSLLTTNAVFRANTSSDVAIAGGANPTIAAQLHVYQPSATGAQPVLRLEQLDTDQPFLRLEGTSASDASASISSRTVSGMVQGHALININGTDRWIAFQSAPTA